MDPRASWSFVVVLLLSAACAAAFAEPVVARVTYISGSSIYIAAGAEDGLAAGDSGEVVRGETLIAELRVTEASAKRSVCRLSAGDAVVEVGDTVRFAAKAAAPEGAAAASAASAAEPEPTASSGTGRSRESGLHGRIGARYLAVKERGEESRGYRQPALDFFLLGAQVYGAPIDVAIDLRARRTYRDLSGGRSEDESRNRLYRAAVAWRRPGEPLSVTLGRQFSPSLGVVSVFDGVLVEHRREGWGGGLFAGSQPDPEDYGFSGDIREYGGFVEWNNRTGAARRWSIGTGLVGSYENSEINREFGFVQARYDDRKLSAFFSGEVDVNRGWRDTAAGESLTFTNSFTTVRYRFSDAFSLNAGYDDRRNPRLYRDYITPETEFDDRHRQGLWAGADGRVGAHFSWGLSGRRSTYDEGGDSSSYTILLGAHRLTAWGLGVRARSTSYTNDFVEGWMHSLSVDADLSSWSHLEIHGGVRDETIVDPTVLDDKLTWYGVEWDVVLKRSWLFGLSYEQSQHEYEGSDQLYAFLTYRF